MSQVISSSRRSRLGGWRPRWLLPCGPPRSGPGSVGVIAADAQISVLSKALSRNGIEHGTLGVDHGDIEHQIDLVPATVAKGLEFDRVVVVEPTAIADAEPDERTGLRRLYVVLTRAVSGLHVIHSEPLPAALSPVIPADPPAEL